MRGSSTPSGAASRSASASSPNAGERSACGGSTASRSRSVSRAATAYAMPAAMRTWSSITRKRPSPVRTTSSPANEIQRAGVAPRIAGS